MEESLQEHGQPALDLRDGILMALIGWNIRPNAHAAIMPSRPSQEGYLGRRITEPQSVIEVKILKLVRPHHFLGTLHHGSAGGCTRGSRNQLRTDDRLQN